MQIFISNPRGWEVKMPGKDVVSSFARKAKKTGILAVAHMPYLPNLASADKETHGKSVSSLMKNIEACNALGIRYLITHMGSHLGMGKEIGMKNILDAMEEVSGSIGRVCILLENQAGHRNSIGAMVEDLRHIYEKSSLGESNLGFCLDTCHLFAAGYDISRADVLEGIDKTLGLGKVHALHLNDAMFPLGSGRDRHSNIGKGEIGIEGFRTLLNYDGISSKVLILETPEGEWRKGELEALRKAAGR